jgi:predicted nucleotidyltransferase
MGMKMDEQTTIKERYLRATESFIDKVKDDPNVIAIIVAGSLAYDQVWEKSDIDMTMVVRDQVLKNDSYCIVEDDITINVGLIVRSGFKRFLDSIKGGSFMHSYLSRGKMVYCTDDSLIEYFEDFKELGRDDLTLSVLLAACELVHHLDKCQKWLRVKKDPLYAQYYLLKAAESIARIEVLISGESPSREAILKAYALNPDMITPYYQDAMSHHYSNEEIELAMSRLEQYLDLHLDLIKQPVIEYMSDGEMKTITMITKYFRTDSHFIIAIFDYLAEQGVIAKISQTIRITPKSKKAVEEITYQYIV